MTHGSSTGPTGPRSRPPIRRPHAYGIRWRTTRASAELSCSPVHQIRTIRSTTPGFTTAPTGSSDSGPGNLHDTWQWDGARWTQTAPAVSPPAVAGGTMAYDNSRRVSVLFGGSGSAGNSSSTWEWDGTNWTPRGPATSPPARVWAAMTYDSARGRVVLFGGDGPSGLLADTWTYDG